MGQQMQNYSISSPGQAMISIEELTAHKAVEEYAEAEELSNGTLVMVEGVGDFNVAVTGDLYTACQH